MATNSNNDINHKEYGEDELYSSDNNELTKKQLHVGANFVEDNLSPANNLETVITDTSNSFQRDNLNVENYKDREAGEKFNSFSEENFNREKYDETRNMNNYRTKEETFEERRGKGESKLLKSTFGTILLVFLLAIISVVSYLPLKNTFIDSKYNTNAYLESAEFAYALGDQVRYFTSPEWYDHRFEQVQSIKYIIKKSGKTEPVTNMESISEAAIEEQKNNSLFYLHLTMKEPGNPIIETETTEKINFDRFHFINTLDLKNANNREYIGLEVTFIIPKNLEAYDDYFSNNIKNFSIEPNFILILTIGAISIFILLIIVFTIPYSYQRKANVCNLYNRMFLELKGIFWAFFVVLFIGTIELIGRNYNYYGGYDLANIIYSANGYFFAIGIPTTFVLYLLIYLTAVYIKYIYYTGFKKGFLENSFFGKIFFYIVRSLKNLFKAAISIDINKEEDKKLMLILGINLIALWIIAATSFIGVFLAIVYTVFLFKYLNRSLTKIKTLNNFSKRLAEGNFEVTLDENIGILSPISKNLNNIKSGFKLAIDEEVKSQRMKTELITNVSHDLKTPLTSIITYVDLLKNEDITEENKKEYIDVLDRKSKRLKALIEDLFEASKASSGNIDLQLEKLDVISLFKQTMGELEEKINESNLHFKTIAPEHKVICELDGRRTYRVFENIITNILKYSLTGSRVYISIDDNEKEVSFTFKNISAYEMNFDPREITERFTRGDKSRNTDGSGLGLAIAKGLVELQGGKLTIDIDGDLFKLNVTFPKIKVV